MVASSGLRVEREPWMASGLCTQIDPELWFPEDGRDGRVRQAITICRRCPVIEQCRRYADKIGAEDGVWGGEMRSTRRFRREYRKRQADGAT